MSDISRSISSGISLWRLGQAGFAIRSPSSVIYVDLCLSDHNNFALPPPFDHRRLTRAPLNPAEINNADLVLCTHDHLDHLDPPTIRVLADSSPSAKLVVPSSSIPSATSLWWPSERVVGTEPGNILQFGDITIIAVPAAHEKIDRTTSGKYPYQGFIIKTRDVTVYHGGDTVSSPQVIAAVRPYRPAICLLPVNGRSPERKELGFAGNLHSEEAVWMTKSVGSSQLIPMHYDMFAQNTDEDWRRRLQVKDAEVFVHLLEVGERFDFDPGKLR